jgi:transposase InsO family protein
MRLMGVEATYPKPHLSRVGEQVQRYPYLLRNVSIERVNQVWSTDITYIRLAHGFLYLVAILDWFSRYVLAWQTSITLDTSFCLDALEQALRLGQPEIFNSEEAGAVHQSRLDFSLTNGSHSHELGWARTSLRQYLCRAALAHGEVRRGLCEGL